VTVPTLIGRELTEVVAELESLGLVPYEEVQTDPQYRYVVVDASEHAGAQLAAGSIVNLIPDFDSTELSFPSGRGGEQRPDNNRSDVFQRHLCGSGAELVRNVRRGQTDPRDNPKVVGRERPLKRACDNENCFDY
jgi:hypothetical protein